MIRHWFCYSARCLLTTGFCLAAPLGLCQTPPTLTLYSWSDYMAPSVIEGFEKRFKAKVEVEVFNDLDEREENLATTQGADFDIICISETYLVQKNIQAWMLALDRSRLPMLKHVRYPMDAEIPEAQRYAVPYFWGTFGIAYRKDLVKNHPQSWRDLYEFSPQHSGRVAMFPTLRLLIGSALLADGNDFNSEVPDALSNAAARLMAQVPHVHNYHGTDLTENNPLVNGQVVISQSYNGDALTLQAFQKDIDYVLPKEGANVWVDYFVIPKTSTHVDLAYAFLNYLNEPDTALENAIYLNYATPNTTARANAPESYRLNNIIFPNEAELAKAHIIKPLSNATLRRYTDILLRVTTTHESSRLSN